MSELETALDEFRTAMLAKFMLRAPRQGDSSVHIDGNLDRMDPKHVEDHYASEIQERFEFGDITPAEKVKEDVDVANMAFLDWYLQRTAAGEPVFPKRDR